MRNLGVARRTRDRAVTTSNLARGDAESYGCLLVYERTDGDSRTNCNPAPNEIAATPSPTPSAAPTPVATTTPSIGKTSFGPGTYLVGIDIQPGLYRSSPAVAGRSCYWERLSDTDGSSGSRIANELIDQGQTYVTIEATDFAFKSERCNEWELLAVPSPTPEPTAFRTPTETPSHTPTSTASTSPSPEPTPTPAPTATLSPTPAPPLTPAELVEQVRNGVVRVKARSGGILFGSTKSGSGFIFAVDGTTAFVATNHHVVEGGNSVEVQVGDSGDFEALVLGWDANKDVAVLSICCSSDLVALPWHGSSPLEGDAVVAIGYPISDSSNLIVTVGEVLGSDSVAEEHGFIAHSAPLNPGNSGGPLFSMPGGELVGMNTARGTQSLSFYAVPYQSIEAQVEAWRAQLFIAPTATPTPTATTKQTASEPFDSVETGGAIYTVHSITEPTTRPGNLPDGKRTLAIDVSVVAVADGIIYDFGQFSIQDSNGHIVEPERYNRGMEPRLLVGNLSTGQRVQGWINFELEKQTIVSAIHVQTGHIWASTSPRVEIARLADD